MGLNCLVMFISYVCNVPFSTWVFQNEIQCCFSRAPKNKLFVIWIIANYTEVMFTEHNFWEV